MKFRSYPPRCLLLVGLACAGAHAELIEIPPSELGSSFELDADGDGVRDLFGGIFSEASGALVFGIRVGATKEAVNLGSNVFRGVSSLRTGTLGELRDGEGFATFFVPPQSVARSPELAGAEGGVFLLPEMPLLGLWTYGTSGGSAGTSDDGPLRLLGWVIDASAYFESDRSEPVKIYLKDYGEITPNGAGRWITLAETGVPLEAELLGGASSEFLGPRKICFQVNSKVGLKYRILRDKGEGDPEEVLVADGNGGAMTLIWDDSERMDSKAFFTLEEFGGRAFAP